MHDVLINTRCYSILQGMSQCHIKFGLIWISPHCLNVYRQTNMCCRMQTAFHVSLHWSTMSPSAQLPCGSQGSLPDMSSHICMRFHMIYIV